MLIGYKKSCDLGPVVLKYARTFVIRIGKRADLANFRRTEGYSKAMVSTRRPIFFGKIEVNVKMCFEGNDFVHDSYTIT